MTCMSCMTLSVTHVGIVFSMCVEMKVMQPIQVMQGTGFEALFLHSMATNGVGDSVGCVLSTAPRITAIRQGLLTYLGSPSVPALSCISLVLKPALMLPTCCQIGLCCALQRLQSPAILGLVDAVQLVQSQLAYARRRVFGPNLGPNWRGTSQA
jgi:hypothetical protein